MPLSAGQQGTTTSHPLNKLQHAVTNVASDITAATTSDKLVMFDQSANYEAKYADGDNVLELIGVTATASELNNAASLSTRVVELTASGAVLTGVQSVELNHASVVVAATMVATQHAGLFIVKDTSATGTAAHTLTLTGGTFNGTATVATLNARDELLAVYFDSAGRGQVIVNIGAVALS